MGKKAKKWYVVIVGREVGVFETWSEAASHISGIPGALHESFNTQEEAYRIFLQEVEKGNTRVIGTQPIPHKQDFRQVKTWNIASVQSSPGLSDTPVPQRLAQPDSPLGKNVNPPSPTILHANVTYTRGPSSSPNVSPRSMRRNTPRVVLRTPPDIASYPSDSEETPSSPTPSVRMKKIHSHTPPYSSLSRVSSKLGEMACMPVFSSRAVAETPSYVDSYPDDSEDILSPLNSPKFFTPDDGLASPKSSSAKGSARADSVEKSDHSQCRHTCPNCRQAAIYVTGPMVPAGVKKSGSKQPVLSVPQNDPRSPMTRPGLQPGHHNSVWSQRPSPNVQLEGQFSALFV